MKKRMIIALTVPLVCLITASSVLLSRLTIPRETAAAREDSAPALTAILASEAAEEVYDESEEVYLLRDLSGYIAVYRLPDAQTPILVTAIRVRGLRRNDADRLTSGLRVAGRENMLKLLEDFGS